MRKNLKEARQKAGMTQQQMAEKNDKMNDKIQTGLRVPVKQYDRIKEQADQIGVSINALILMLIDIGLNQIEYQPKE